MALSPGTRLGPYEIDAPIGAGGMGEVYRARDTRLDRVVAIKVLREPLAADPAGRERFEREARAVSSLNHPHICALYDVGPDYLVLEHLEGETLADRLARGAIPVKQALRIAIQIADALDRAHRAGVVHRDLKPANVFLVAGPDTNAKLLDFGLAQRGRLASDVAAHGSLATAPAALTAAGTILGTLQYMAPEQVEGQDADARTDIFAFGLVLHEMLSGRRAFDGKTQAALISAILAHDPPRLVSSAPDVPPALQHVVDRSLAKHPDARWQSARDIAAELEWIAAGGGAPAVVSRRPGTLRTVAWTAGVAALAVVATLWAVRRPAPPGPSVLRFDIPTPPTDAAVKGSAPPVGHFSLAPDGSRLAYAAGDGRGSTVLWVHAFADGAGKTLRSTTGATFPFWSPDGRSLGFFADGVLKRLDVETGSVQTICDAPDPRGGTWAPDDTVLLAPITGDGLYRVSAQGGDRTPVTRMDRARNETAHRWPVFLPDGRHFLFHVSRNPDITEIAVGSLDDARTTPLVQSPFHAVYGSGHIVFAREGVLFAQPFDARRLALTGPPAIIAPTVIGNSRYHGAFDVSSTGVLVHASSSPATTELGWFDRRGARVETLDSPDSIDAELSPDGRHVAFGRIDRRYATADIWIRDLSTHTESRVTSSPSNDGSPLWSSDGKRLVLRSASTGLSDLFIKIVGGDRLDPLLLSDRNKVTTAWSSDGRFLVFHAAAPATALDVWLLPMEGNVTPRPLLASRFNEFAGRVSPDGRHLAYVSDESGTSEVYVVTFPRPGEKRPVSFGGGYQPRWRGDGGELFFLSGEGKMMSAGVRLEGGRFETTRPVALFQTAVPSLGNPYVSHYAVSADGQRFLITHLDKEGIASLSVTVNWPAALKR